MILEHWYRIGTPRGSGSAPLFGTSTTLCCRTVVRGYDQKRSISKSGEWGMLHDVINLALLHCECPGAYGFYQDWTRA